MRALITGGAGFIGSHLTDLLLARGGEVAIIDDLSTGRLGNVERHIGNPRFHLTIENIAQEMILDRLVSECDVIFHLAAAVGVELIIRSPVSVIETNIHGTEVVLRCAQRYRKKILFASTSEIYGKNQRVPFSEEADQVLGPPTRRRWLYAASKSVDETLVQAYHEERGLPTVIFRLFNTIGPRQTGRYGMVVPRFVRQALEGKPLTVYGDGEQTRCFCHVADVVRALVALAESPAAVGQVFNIGSTQEVTIDHLAHLVKSMTHSTSDIDYIPYDQAYEPGFEDMSRRVPDTSKILRVIGWQPEHTLEQILGDVIAYESAKIAGDG